MVIVMRRSTTRSPERVQRDMEDLFRALVPHQSRGAVRHDGGWRPPLEVYESAGGMTVMMEVAGMTEEGFSIVVEGDVLSVRGERIDRRGGSARRYHETGVPYGRFTADVFLPFPVDLDAASAEYDNGFLWISLPRLAPHVIVPRRPAGNSLELEK